MRSRTDALDRVIGEIAGKIGDLWLLLLDTSTGLTARLDAVEGRMAQAPHTPGTYLGDGRVLTTTRWGGKMILPARDLSLTPYLLADGVWEGSITNAFLDLVEEGMNIVEVGANVGYYTLLGAYRIGPDARYWAFEASAEAFNYLHANVEIGGLRDRATLVNQAVYSERASLTLHVRSEHLGDSSVIQPGDELPPTPEETVHTVPVEAITLDDYFAESDAKIDLVKIDAEGSEPHILRGMAKMLEERRDIRVIFEFVPRWIAKTVPPETFVADLRARLPLLADHRAGRRAAGDRTARPPRPRARGGVDGAATAPSHTHEDRKEMIARYRNGGKKPQRRSVPRK